MSTVTASIFTEPGDTVVAHMGEGIATLTFDSGKARVVLFTKDREWLASLILAAQSADDALAIQEFEGSL